MDVSDNEYYQYSGRGSNNLPQGLSVRQGQLFETTTLKQTYLEIIVDPNTELPEPWKRLLHRLHEDNISSFREDPQKEGSLLMKLFKNLVDSAQTRDCDRPTSIHNYLKKTLIKIRFKSDQIPENVELKRNALIKKFQSQLESCDESTQLQMLMELFDKLKSNIQDDRIPNELLGNAAKNLQLNSECKILLKKLHRSPAELVVKLEEFQRGINKSLQDSRDPKKVADIQEQ